LPEPRQHRQVGVKCDLLQTIGVTFVEGLGQESLTCPACRTIIVIRRAAGRLP
jgi:hypothetical protein